MSLFRREYETGNLAQTMNLRCLLSTIALLVLCLATRADIVPTQYSGGTLVPLEVSDLRLHDARVRITWGMPCSLQAAFEIMNDRQEPISLEIGFPVGGYDPLEQEDQHSRDGTTEAVAAQPVAASIIEITINGKTVPTFRRVRIPQQCEIRFGHASWYFAKATLIPGKNEIQVKTSLTPAEVYCRPFERRLEYCLWTGGRWNGEIQHETIEIIFPQPISGTLIQEVKPQGFKIAADRLVWEFTNIEPKNDFFDIDLVVQIPEIDSCLTKLDQQYRDDPQNEAAALKLAQHLLLLGSMKGNTGIPPEALSTTEYYRFLDRLKGEDKDRFVRHYSVFRNMNVMAISSEWTEDRMGLIQILADLDYCENYPGVGNVLRAKRILDEMIVGKPRNEAAWLLLLNNYWRFSFAAKGHWFGTTVFSSAHKRDIEKAHRACPQSRRIAEWYELLQAKNGAEAKVPRTSLKKLIKNSEFAEIMKRYEPAPADEGADD